MIDACIPKNHSVAGLLRSTRPKAIDGRMLVLEVFYKFHKEQLELEPKRLILEKALEETVGPLGVRCVLGERILQVSQQIVEHDDLTATPEDKQLASTVESVFGL